MLIHELLYKDPDIVPEEAPLIILYSKYDVCMDNNGKDTNHTRHIARRVYFLRNDEKWKMNIIDWYEVGMQLADIATRNFGDNVLNTRNKYIMLRLDNWMRTLVQEGLQNTG